MCWRHGGAVPWGLSKKGRHVGPPHTQRLVTTLTAWTPSPVVCLSHKRWAVDLLNWERHAGLGVGEQPGRGDSNRSEPSVGIAVRASLYGLRVCHHEIVPGKPWSIVQGQHALR